MSSFGAARRRATLEAVSAVEWSMRIGSRWEPPKNEPRDLVDPYNGATYAKIGDASPLQVRAAVTEASLMKRAWAASAPSERAYLLRRLADQIDAHADVLAAMETLQTGKPYVDAYREIVNGASEVFRWYAGMADRAYGDVYPRGHRDFTYSTREPFGVVAANLPFNFPVVMFAWKVAPALAFGNTIVVKPSEIAPLSALRVAELAEGVGVPAGVLNVVVGGPVVGRDLVSDPSVDKIVFTGSTQTGRLIAQEAAKNLKPVTLELGGKTAAIVARDADLDEAARGIASGFLYNAGQCCTAWTRILVPRAFADDFAHLLHETIEKEWRTGDPFDGLTNLGPVASRVSFDRVSRAFALSEADGLSVAFGGKLPDPEIDGFAVPPTLFFDVNRNAAIAREEVFAPVACLIAYDDDDEAIAIANDTPYGLAAAIWTSDVRRARAWSRRLEAGTVWINRFSLSDPGIDFGGTKASGYGRELGPSSVETYTYSKTIVEGVEPEP